MGFWNSVFSRNRDLSPQGKHVFLSRAEADDLLYRLQVRADFEYDTASEHERRSRSWRGLSPLIKVLGQARVDHDFDAMLVYDEFSLFQNRTMELCFPTLRKALGVRYLHGLITQRHLDIHAKAVTAFYEVGGKSSQNKEHTAEWEQLAVLLFKDRLDEADLIINLMQERGVYSARELSGLMDARDEVASPLMNGAL